MKREPKNILYYILIGILMLAILSVIIVYANSSTPAAPAPTMPDPTIPEPLVITETVEVEVEKLVEVEKTITSSIIQEGLRDMGTLITQEYYFTEVMDFAKVKQVSRTDWTLLGTESAYVASYDGVIAAGVDLTRVRVAKNDAQQQISVTVPPAQVQYIDIDLDSFRLYSEKQGLFNPLSATDFNKSLTELETTAQARALERGLLEKADENAKTVIKNFVKSLVSPEYKLIFIKG